MDLWKLSLPTYSYFPSFETEHMRTPYKQNDLKKLTSQKEAMDETEYIMSSPAMVEILRQGQKDIEEGRGRVIKLDEIWK